MPSSNFIRIYIDIEGGSKLIKIFMVHGWMLYQLWWSALIGIQTNVIFIIKKKLYFLCHAIRTPITFFQFLGKTLPSPYSDWLIFSIKSRDYMGLWVNVGSHEFNQSSSYFFHTHSNRILTPLISSFSISIVSVRECECVCMCVRERVLLWNYKKSALHFS